MALTYIIFPVAAFKSINYDHFQLILKKYRKILKYTSAAFAAKSISVCYNACSIYDFLARKLWWIVREWVIGWRGLGISALKLVDLVKLRLR